MKRRCTAKSKQRGSRCKLPPIPGGAVCRFHGGRAPQVKRKAAERLALLADPAIDALNDLVKTRSEPTVRLATAKTILDRTGYGAPRRFEIGGGDIEMSNYTEPDAETLDAGDAERFRGLTDRFESGSILTRKEQIELHALRQRAGLKSWLKISTSGATAHLPENGREQMRGENDADT